MCFVVKLMELNYKCKELYVEEKVQLVVGMERPRDI